MRLMLAGNPNSGKTTVFNRLTGNHQHIGNFPGITVEYKRGYYAGHEIIDLPGLYSLEPTSAEERLAAAQLKESPPDGIINCIDMTNLRRSLALTLSLAELGIPMIIVANMLEECRPKPDLQALEQKLGIPIFAVRQQNRWAPAALLRMMLGTIEKQQIPRPLCPGDTAAKLRWVDEQKIASSNRPKEQWIDHILMHPILGTIAFLGIISTVFYLTFQRIGPYLTAPFMQGIEGVSTMAESLSPPLLRLTVQGAVAGVGTVFSFLPTVMLLFFFLAILEDSGYMVRICYLTENILRLVGLSGRSAVPLLMGFGCTVPAALAARITENKHQQRRTLRMLPFVSCSAKLPVYGILAQQICPQYPLLPILAIYAAGIGLGLLITAFLPRQTAPLLMELPPYRLPKLTNLAHRLWRQTKAFTRKTFSVLLGASVVVTLLQHLTLSMQYTEIPAESILATLAGVAVPLFKPIGLGKWELIAALLAGLFAKESIVSVLAVTGATVAEPLSFLIFAGLYPPCIAALTTLRREAGWLFTAVTVLIHLLVAYLAAWLL